MESGLFVRRTGRNRFGSRYRCSLLCLRKYGICRWQREEIQVLPSMPQCWVVLVKPRMSVSTRTVFREVDTQAIQHQDIHGLAEAIREQDYQQMIKNGKQFRRYNGKRHPVIHQIKERMIKYGADAALMSGSGPTVLPCVNIIQERREYIMG